MYPYDYVDSLKKLSDKQLPSKEEFYLRLNNTEISDEDYQHAQNVWNVFGMKSMRQYHDLYLKSDVLLLADVFENFRDMCMSNYKLNPCWYYTSPGLSWDALLKTTNIYLENIKDPDMHLFFEKGTRGGISIITTRYGEANNPYMGDEYDSEKPTKYITYLKNWISKIGEMFHAQCSHAHNEYSLAAERLVVGKVEKLIHSLSSKTKYVVNHKTLKC